MMNRIQSLIKEFQKSIIQSEAEVRSKLIVPLLEILNYPSSLRAEEFPVYGFEGGKRLPTKNADFILFTDRDFATHRDFTANNINWVHEHCLLVVEAKKPGEMPSILGQPQYYAIWTRAVAYLAIDGIRIRGYYYNRINADYKVIDCTLDDLPQHIEILSFKYNSILEIKQHSASSFITISNAIEGEATESTGMNLVTEADLTNLPENTWRYMRYALGRNATGLSNLKLISKFLNLTDSYLQNDMRYDIPEYMFDMPRKTHSAYLHLEDTVLPIETGKATEFYWNEYERFIYQSDYLQIVILCQENSLVNFEIGFRALDRRVSDRLASFEKIYRILNAKTIRVSLDDNCHRQFFLSTRNPQKMWTSKEDMLSRYDSWLEDLKQLRLIEEFYEVQFDLKHISSHDELIEMYDSLSYVHAGITLTQNCEINLPGGMADEDIHFEEPTIFEDTITNPPNVRCLFGVKFIPSKSWILPGTINMKGTTSNDVIAVPGCIRYKIVG